MFLAIGLFLAALIIGYIFVQICMYTDMDMGAIPVFVFALFFCIYLAVNSGVTQQLAVVLALFGAFTGTIISVTQYAYKMFR